MVPSLDLRWLREQHWGGGEYVERAITSRLENLDRMGAVLVPRARRDANATLDAYYEAAIRGDVLVLDLSHLSNSLQKAVSRAMTHRLEHIAEREETGRGGGPGRRSFSRRHTFTSPRRASYRSAPWRGTRVSRRSSSPTPPPRCPDYVLRSADNLVVMRINHRDDLRTLGQGGGHRFGHLWRR